MFFSISENALGRGRRAAEFTYVLGSGGMGSPPISSILGDKAWKLASPRRGYSDGRRPSYSSVWRELGWLTAMSSRGLTFPSLGLLS